ncbi:unnamed protein product [Heligmosomoides polygyrus]|uniref:Protein kinase domain-containing protein n=1 Tax=Heligmosomoides polygyrus TaxID=6339 RepID=A0A183G313_HELPZ|nr:unnamed protein product [Heligmosomoides polygyrus]
MTDLVGAQFHIDTYRSDFTRGNIFLKPAVHNQICTCCFTFLFEPSIYSATNDHLVVDMWYKKHSRRCEGELKNWRAGVKITKLISSPMDYYVVIEKV